MKCRNCKYNGFLLDPDEERECRHYARATHADQIRAKTDEELAVWIALQTPGISVSVWLDWLRQEVVQ